MAMSMHTKTESEWKISKKVIAIACIVIVIVVLTPIICALLNIEVPFLPKKQKTYTLIFVSENPSKEGEFEEHVCRGVVSWETRNETFTFLGRELPTPFLELRLHFADGHTEIYHFVASQIVVREE